MPKIQALAFAEVLHIPSYRSTLNVTGQSEAESAGCVSADDLRKSIAYKKKQSDVEVDSKVRTRLH
jgi:hypothetical protein